MLERLTMGRENATHDRLRRHLHDYVVAPSLGFARRAAMTSGSPSACRPRVPHPPLNKPGIATPDTGKQTPQRDRRQRAQLIPPGIPAFGNRKGSGALGMAAEQCR